MAIQFDLIKEGDVLYDYHSERAGITTMRRWGNWEVKIISIDRASRSAVVRWNGNRPETYYYTQLTRLRRKPGKEREQR